MSWRASGTERRTHGAQRRSLVLALAALLVAGCSGEATEATPSPQGIMSTDSATASAPSSSPPVEGSETTPSESASPDSGSDATPGPVPTVDPSDPQTLVGVWQTSQGLELVLNGQGYFASVDTGSGERFDNGTWEVQDGALVLTTTVRRHCIQDNRGTYQLQSSQASGTVEFESVSDPCRGRREDIEGGLTWLRPDD
jgi:hypothetical protein